MGHYTKFHKKTIQKRSPNTLRFWQNSVNQKIKHRLVGKSPSNTPIQLIISRLHFTDIFSISCAAQSRTAQSAGFGSEIWLPLHFVGVVAMCIYCKALNDRALWWRVVATSTAEWIGGHYHGERHHRWQIRPLAILSKLRSSAQGLLRLLSAGLVHENFLWMV